MTLADWAQLAVSLVAVVIAAYVLARIDLWWIHRSAQRESEQQRIIDLLRQPNE